MKIISIQILMKKWLGDNKKRVIFSIFLIIVGVLITFYIKPQLVRVIVKFLFVAKPGRFVRNKLETKIRFKYKLYMWNVTNPNEIAAGIEKPRLQEVGPYVFQPYRCTICDKAYKTSSMRAAHMDAHIEGKTFPCTMCDKKLQTRTSYRNHMKRHTEEKKHQCEHCGKKFFTKFHVKLHASKIHVKGKYKPLKAPSNVIQIEYEDMVDTLDDEQVVSSYG